MHKHDIILLFESLVSKQKVEEIRVRLRFECCYAIDNIWRSGGIGILWRIASLCALVNSAVNFVNFNVMDKDIGILRLTTFYGCPKRTRRKESSSILRTIAASTWISWVYMGDFNDILSQDDKFGLHEHHDWYKKGFVETM